MPMPPRPGGVEIAAHGSPVVLELLLRRALCLGARLAEPGEFTQRAFLAGKIGFTQIPVLIEEVLHQTPAGTLASIDEVLKADETARRLASDLCESLAPVLPLRS